jgi:hypothetical protein
MKKTIFIVILTTCLTNSFSQITRPTLDLKSLNFSSKNSSETLDLNYIGYTDKPYLYSLFVGQKVLFFSRNNESTINVDYYENFSLTHFDTLWTEKPDTIWHRIKEHPKPKDYTIVPIVSDKYKPVFIKNKRVSDCNIGQSNIDSLKTGYYTPANEIEGKSFKIIKFDSQKCLFGKEEYYKIVFTMMSENNDTIIWRTNSLISKYHCFPLILVSTLEKYKENFLGKEFRVQESSLPDKEFVALDLKNLNNYIKLHDDLKCTDLKFIGYKNEFMIPCLILQDSIGQQFGVSIAETPNAKWYLRTGDDNIFTKPTKYNQIVAKPNDLVDIEIIKEQNRIQKETKLAAEKKELQEKENAQKEVAVHRMKLIKKYGKHYANIILEGSVQIGMTKQMCIESWGKPEDINTTIGSYGRHEQWVYGNGNYLYFENGILTTIQN